MALINSKKLPISSVLCYKDKLLVSLIGDPLLQLYSLGGVPYPHLDSINLQAHAKSMDWGVKKDLILVCTNACIFIIKVDDR